MVGTRFMRESGVDMDWIVALGYRDTRGNLERRIRDYVVLGLVLLPLHTVDRSYPNKHVRWSHKF